ncbi:hypothetical protein WAE61_18240 [Comamonadaceae bacterium PP-2]
MANEENLSLTEQVELAKAQAWANADARAAIEAVRWAIERARSPGQVVTMDRFITHSIREAAEAYLVAKSTILGADVGEMTSLELDALREKFSDEARELIDREIKVLSKTRAADAGRG